MQKPKTLAFFSIAFYIFWKFDMKMNKYESNKNELIRIRSIYYKTLHNHWYLLKNYFGRLIYWEQKITKVL